MSWSALEDSLDQGKGQDLTTYENLYGSELNMFESFFPNELDYYLTDLADLSSDTMLFVKNEPTSPQSFTESTTSPSSPGESSAGPSSPETKQGAKRGRFSDDDDLPAAPMPTNVVPDEERQVKRQRRLIKNRESAQKSRMRKKMYIEDLETKVKSLASHNDILLQENNALKEEITYLTKFINKTPGLAEEIAHSRPKGTVPPIRNVKAAGVCLLIVLFSFGLYFNNVQQFGNNGPALPFEGGAREPIPEVLPFGGERRHGRMLKSFKDAVPSLVSETEEVGDLTPIYPKRRLPPVDMDGPLESVIQRNKKVGTGLSPYKKIKLEEDSMDVVDASCTEELEKGSFVVPQLPSTDGLLPEAAQLHEFVRQGPRNDTGAETTGYTDN
jgi:hypothetical protein